MRDGKFARYVSKTGSESFASYRIGDNARASDGIRKEDALQEMVWQTGSSRLGKPRDPYFQIWIMLPFVTNVEEGGMMKLNILKLLFGR